MSNVNAEIKWQGNDNAWFTANASTVYPANIQIFHIDGRYKFTDGVTTLSALPFLGGNSYILTDAEIGSVINSAASATPNDTDLVMSVDTSVAKKNTWTQIKAFLKTYFDTLFVKKGTITNNTILKGSSTDTATNSQITDDGTTVKINNKTEITDNDLTLYNTSHINAHLDTSDTYGGSLRIYDDLGNLVANITGKDFATYFNTNYSFGIGTATPKGNTKLHVKTNTNQNLLVYEYAGKLTVQAENDAGSAYSSLQFYCDFELPLLNASQIVGTDANKKLVSIPFGTTAGTVMEGNGAPAETVNTIGTLINGSTAAVPNDTDLVATADTSVLKKITWSNVKAFLKTYFDTIYQSALGYTAENTANKSSSYTVSSTTTYANTKALVDGLGTKQDTLSSGTNIKTFNGASILGSGAIAIPCEVQLAASDESTALTAGTAKISFRMPFAMTVTEVRASLVTAQASGSIFTVDINEAGTSIISTKITIDNTELTSTTAATPPVISDNSLADDALITVDIDQIGDGTAKGLKILLKGTRT